MKRSLILLIVCFSVCLPSCKFIKKRGWFGTKKAESALILQARQDSIRLADSLQNVMARNAAIEQARLDSLNRIEQERLAYEARFKYHIIVGSFITPQYARDFQAYIQNEGYNSKIIQKPDSRFELVAAESHESLRKAVDRLIQFRDTVAYDAWIYIHH